MDFTSNFKFAKALSALVFKVLGVPVSVQQENRDSSPARGFLIIANHQSLTDSLALIQAFQTPIAFWVERKFSFFPLFRQINSAMRDPYQTWKWVDSNTIQMLKTLLNNGIHLVIFLKENQNKTGWFPPDVEAAASLIRESQERVILVKIGGTGVLLPWGTIVPKINPVNITIGNPIDNPFSSQEEKFPQELVKFSTMIGNHFSR